MASPSTIITLGYGSFGSVNLLVTLGYGIASAAASIPGGICQQVLMRPAIQQVVEMSGGINQAVDMRPAFQQTVRMGCVDGC